jgi:hypothetical protein
MEEVFVSRMSAVARILTARQALLKDSDRAHGLSAGEKAAQVERLDRLLFDVRAGRMCELVMPAPNGEIRVFVTPD